jgi:hypothetical protein
MNTLQDAITFINSASESDIIALQQFIELRKQSFSAVKLGSYQIGDRVKFNTRTRPEYLQGSLATITEIRRTRVSVKLDKPVGRFWGQINTHPTLIEKV